MNASKYLEPLTGRREWEQTSQLQTTDRICHRQVLEVHVTYTSTPDRIIALCPTQPMTANAAAAAAVTSPPSRTHTAQRA